MPRPFRLCAPRDLCIEFRSCRVARVQVGDRGPYVLQAALAACHARARRAADTDWPRIAALYVPLRVVAPSPVIDLNRAMRTAWPSGPRRASDCDFLFRAGRLAEARSECKAAASLTRNARERAFLLARADACGCQH